jgi:hypothetical protein
MWNSIRKTPFLEQRFAPLLRASSEGSFNLLEDNETDHLTNEENYGTI